MFSSGKFTSGGSSTNGATQSSYIGDVSYLSSHPGRSGDQQEHVEEGGESALGGHLHVVLVHLQSSH